MVTGLRMSVMQASLAASGVVRRSLLIGVDNVKECVFNIGRREPSGLVQRIVEPGGHS